MTNAVKNLTAFMGTLAGIVAMEHAVGEILQGNHAPQSLMFLSWPDAPFFASLGGEPAMSLIPNFLISGLLTILLALIFILCALRFSQQRYSSLALILLSVALLLTGGGFGPPLLGLIIGAGSTRLHAHPTGQTTRAPRPVQRFLARLWPWSFGICIAAWFFLLPGVPLLHHFFGVDDPTLTYLSIFLAFGSLGLAIFSSRAHDRLAAVVPAGLPLTPSSHPALIASQGRIRND
jgi:hypothetical protein